MNIFTSTLNQTAFLFIFIAIGYFLMKIKFLPENSSSVLSKLENALFIPALVMGTFIKNFTVKSIGVTGKLMLISFIIAFIAIPIAILAAKILTKDKYTQNIYAYGLSFSNFAFMGNAIVSSIFPDIFFEYLIFTLPLWFLIYVFGAPKWLIADSDKKQTFKESAKALINPMFVAMIIGMIIGMTGIKLPKWIDSAITTSGNCMSPVAMLLTGMTVATISLKDTFKNLNIYAVSIVRLIVMPMILILLSPYLPLSKTVYICAVCTLAMPLGLNTIVIPSAYGKDTTAASGMAVISHILSCITIPIIFTLIK